MLILGQPDYYDYLANIYGKDEKVIYNRKPEFYRRGTPSAKLILEDPQPFKLSDHIDAPKYSNDYFKEFYLAVCGALYPAIYVYKDKKFFWLDDIKSTKYFHSMRKDNILLDFKKPTKHLNRHYVKSNNYLDIYNPLPSSTKINHNLNCPVILILGQYSFNKWSNKWYIGDIATNPVLKDLNASSILPPDCIYQEIYNFLINAIPDSRHEILTDKEKIDSKGFDKKKSFRHRNL